MSELNKDKCNDQCLNVDYWLRICTSKSHEAMNGWYRSTFFRRERLIWQLRRILRGTRVVRKIKIDGVYLSYVQDVRRNLWGWFMKKPKRRWARVISYLLCLSLRYSGLRSKRLISTNLTSELYPLCQRDFCKWKNVNATRRQFCGFYG